MKEITDKLFALRDEKYAAFQAKLLPGIDSGSIIGVRTPALRALAKEMLKDGTAAQFIKELPHGYFEENQLHAFIISGIKDFDTCVSGLEEFLPFVDNWATCDQMSPKVFRRETGRLLPLAYKWIDSPLPFTVRFGTGMLMEHFLGDNFEPEFARKVAEIRSDEYYVNMMSAWYFATALAKQYDAVIPFIEKKQLPVWVHNKAIQKARESYRITPEQKEYLKALKIKESKE